MQLNVKCTFINKREFEKALEYLKPIVGGDIAYSGKDFDDNGEVWHLETYASLTQDQLNGLTALCPIRPIRPITKESIYNKIAFMIGRLGDAYHPEDPIEVDDPNEQLHLEMLQNDIGHDCDALGLDPCAIALEVLCDLEISSKRFK